jgi:hypothetical protein
MKTYSVFIVAGIGAIVIVGVIIALNMFQIAIATQDYDIYVDPIIDEQNLFVMARITIQNTGSQSLTNVRVNFGGGDTLELGTLDAGKKIIVSPPPDNEMLFVQVSADHDIFVSKAYRSLPKMVGMMGS